MLFLSYASTSLCLARCFSITIWARFKLIDRES